METKICESCSKLKNLKTFKPFTKKDGSSGSLKHCGSCRAKQGEINKANGLRLSNSPYFDKNRQEMVKVCSKCRNLKPVTDFHKNKAVKMGVMSNCKACQKQMDAVRYSLITDADKESLNEKRKAEGYKHQKNFRLNNLEAFRKKHAEYAKRPKYRAKSREWQRNQTPDQKKAYYDRNREAIRRARMVRRAREKNCAFIFPFTKASIIKRDGLYCYLCGVLTTEKDCHIEHILPLVRGGHHKPENVKIACAFCNQSKGVKTLTEFKKRRGDYDKYKLKIRL